jgi:hypothetical protein
VKRAGIAFGLVTVARAIYLGSAPGPQHDVGTLAFIGASIAVWCVVELIIESDREHWR